MQHAIASKPLKLLKHTRVAANYGPSFQFGLWACEILCRTQQADVWFNRTRANPCSPLSQTYGIVTAK
jgi:hypothetical protein